MSRRKKWIVLALILSFVALRPTLRNTWHNKVADRPLHVLRVGAGPPVVLLHGLTGSHEYFAPLTTSLSRHYTVTAPDLLGFGASPWPDSGYTVDDHLRALMPVLPKEPFVLVGHSMGSLLALELARRYPQRVAALVLLAPPSIANRAAMKAMLGSHAGLGTVMELDSFWAPLACHMHETFGSLAAILMRPFVDSKLPFAVVRSATEHRWASYQGSLEGVVFKVRPLEIIPELRVPLTVLAGFEDVYSQNETLRKVFPATVVMAGGHNFFWEQPQLVIARIEQALAATYAHQP